MRERCKDLVGKTARLTRPVVLNSGTILPFGLDVTIWTTWRGRFTLETPGTGKIIARNVPRGAFEIVG